MSLILVVEKDAGFANRIAATLRADGYTIDAVASCDAGLQHAVLRAPSLVLVSGVLPGAPDLLARYANKRGGPGSVVLVPAPMAEQMSADQFHADYLLPNPVPENDLLDIARRLAPTDDGIPPGPSLLPNVGAQLTSEQIFGDVLAEVEADASERPRPSSPEASRPPSAADSRPAAPPSAPPSQAAPAAPAASPQPPRRRRSRGHDDIDRKLEETLSGFFPDKLRGAAKEPAKAKKAAVPSADEIEDLLDKTLSSLELPSFAKRPRKAAKARAPEPPPATTPAVTPSSEPPRAPESVVSQPPQTPKPTAPIPPQAPPAARLEPPRPPEASSPPAAAVPPVIDLRSPAETLRLEKPLDPDAGGWSLPPDPEPVLPATSVPHPPAGIPPASASEASAPPPFDFASPVAESGTPSTSFLDLPGSSLEPDPPPTPVVPAAEDSGSFDLPSIEPLPAPESWFDPATSVAELSPEPELPVSELEVPAELPSLDLPEMPAHEGWSVSSFEDLPTPEIAPSPPSSLESLSPPPVDLGPQSFMLEDREDPPPVDADYPTDFASAFSLPAGENSLADDEGPGANAGLVSSFSPDPTETIDPEDTEGLQRTLDNVLQIRDGAAPVHKKSGVPFGDYRLLERVAVGGMAEVWRAQRRGVEGFQKTVAIKKILSHLTGSHDFVTMFIDEAKLAAQLNHANIIQIYDLGKVDDDFFIAMEFVDGKDLRSIQNRAKDLGEKVPMGLCLVTVAAVARALDYAHRKRDFDNRALGLVHRDVSPQNVLISYEGEIKLCDFGIVKAVAKASTTQMGALKGKLQYMSPEQAWGKEVDARSDIFSLGSVLFEMLTGERLFTGDSEIGVLDAVRDCRIRSPRSLDPDVPPEVDAIVMKALAKTPETRYQTAGEMVRDITAVLEHLRPAVGQADLASLMGHLFGPRATAKAEKAAGSEPPAADTPADAKAVSAKAPPEKRGGGSRTWLVAAIVLLALAAVVVILVMSLGDASSSQAPSSTPAAAADQAPPPAPASGLPAATADTENADQGGEVPPDGETGDAAAQAPGSVDPDAASKESSAAEGEEDSGADLSADDQVQKMIQEALDSEKQKMAQDFEAQKRRLEEELAKVQESAEEGSGDDDGGGGGGGDG